MACGWVWPRIDTSTNIGLSWDQWCGQWGDSGLHLLTLALPWGTQSSVPQNQHLSSFLQKPVEGSLQNWHPKCNHSQLQAWGSKHCSCIKVNYFRAFRFQKSCGSLKTEQSEPHVIAGDLVFYGNFCSQTWSESNTNKIKGSIQHLDVDFKKSIQFYSSDLKWRCCTSQLASATSNNTHAPLTAMQNAASLHHFPAPWIYCVL